MVQRRTVLTGIAAATLPRAGQAAERVLRIAMTAADIPLTTGQANNGAEGQRFVGMQLYDGLINWDLSRGDAAAKLRPALAAKWAVDDATKTVWTFNLRPGVLFHDGSVVTADAIVWNLDKLMNKEAKQFDPAQAAQGATYVAAVKSYRAIDPATVEITTKQPDAVFPYQVALIAISSPARWAALDGSWARFAEKPSGTGPWIQDVLLPRNRAEFVRNARYWDPARVPKADRLVLLPVPDGNTRVAALLSGQVDWIEAPPPDTVARLKSGGMNVVTNVYPHIWPYQLSFAEGSPMRDMRVRKALNLAIDRDSIVQLMGGLALPARGMVDPKHPWFGKPSFDIRYDAAQARALLAEAGYSKQKPLQIKAIVSPSGSGQMQPQQINEIIQQNYADVGVTLVFDTMEWEALRARRRAGAAAPENRGAHMINNSWGYWDPDIGLISPAWSRLVPPAGFNWGGYSDPAIDALCVRAKNAFVPAEQDAILAELHTAIVDQAMWIWVVHDLNPRAMRPEVTGFVQAQSWWQDLTPVSVG